MTHRRAALLIAALLVAACGGSTGSPAPSPSVASSPPAEATTPPSPSASPTLSLGAGPPTAVMQSGLCMRTGVCSTVDVAEWDSLSITPLVDCGGGKSCQLQMKVFAPTSGGPWPLAVVVPGGHQGTSDQAPLDPFGLIIAGQGAVAIETVWRQEPDAGGGYPTSFADVACAIGVARKIGPSYGASPDRVTLVGASIGGWAATVLGLTPTPFTPSAGSCDPTAGSLRPDAVVSVAGILDQVTAPANQPYVMSLLNGDRAARPDAWAAVDPFALAKRYPADAVRFLLIEGGADTYVSPAAARAFQASLAALGYQSSLVEILPMAHEEAYYCNDAYCKDLIGPIMAIVAPT